MRPLSLDDLMPLGEYAGRRREFRDALQRYLDRYRRVRIGPRVTVLFENRQTLWYRIHEVIRVARLADPRRLQDELELYNRLLPGRDQLQAALLIDMEGDTQQSDSAADWQDLHGDDLVLHAGEQAIPAHLVTCRPEDLCIGAAHWVVFTIDSTGRSALADFTRPAILTLSRPAYRHQSPPLSDEVRQSLLDDLSLSDKDAA